MRRESKPFLETKTVKGRTYHYYRFGVNRDAHRWRQEMTSWVTYARPFAARRAFYRRREREFNDRLFRSDDDEADDDFLERRAMTAYDCALAIDYAWLAFKDHMVLTPPPTE